MSFIILDSMIYGDFKDFVKKEIDNKSFDFEVISKQSFVKFKDKKIVNAWTHSLIRNKQLFLRKHNDFSVDLSFYKNGEILLSLPEKHLL